MLTFDHLILNGRPGGGKSELIDFLKRAGLDRRAERYHVGEVVELDDFVWLWDKFVEDDLWEALGEPRLYSRRVAGGYAQAEGDRLLEMLAAKLGHVVQRDYASRPSFYETHTLFIEFARGVGDGGYRRAYERLSGAVLERAAILYISVSYEESRRRNEARYREQLAHSVLAHKLPDEALARFSAEQDWEALTGGRDAGHLDLGGRRVPFVTVVNEPEVTGAEALDARYQPALRRLMALYRESRPPA